MRAPEFWQQRAAGRGNLAAACLAPAGWLFAAGGWLRHKLSRPRRVDVPVICVGNLVAGGAGKTPTVLALAALLEEMHPHVLTRGYPGKRRGPLWVDRSRHSVADVGDEALLLSRHLPTIIARNRVAGAITAANAGAGLVLMDDGFQNPSLVKDIALLVVDTGQSFGNGRCIPAGPLREPVARGLARADAIVLIGDGPFQAPARLPVFAASIQPECEASHWAGRRVVAFAGIGRPQKFFDTLTTLGAEVVSRHAFADHHVYSEAELQHLKQALPTGASLVTTEKDYVRLPRTWQAEVETLPVALQFEDPAAVSGWLHARLEAAW